MGMLGSVGVFVDSVDVDGKWNGSYARAEEASWWLL